jgi:hypothetical protein
MSFLNQAEAILNGSGEGFRDDVHAVEEALRMVIAHLRIESPGIEPE